LLYGSNDLHERAKANRPVPLCLLPGARLLRDMPKDQVITHDMVALDTGTTLYHLRALQDGGHAGIAAETPGAAARTRQLEEAV
jgi:predicted homoserine dehydrogenase-like protein